MEILDGTGAESNIGSPADNTVQYGTSRTGIGSSQRSVTNGPTGSSTMPSEGASRGSGRVLQ